MDHKACHRTFVRAGLALAIAMSASGTALAKDSANGPRTWAKDKGSWRISLGANYSTGDYGQPVNTKIWSIPLALRYSRDRFRIRLSVPYVFLNGPGSLLDRPDGGGVDVGGGTLRPEHHQGVGDVAVSAGYLLPLGDGISLDATARVKLPTASRAKRLGTGKLDVTAGFDLVKGFGGGSIYVGARRRFVGDPAGANLRDVWGFGAGGNARIAHGLGIGIDYGWRQSSRIGGGDISELSVWTSARLNKRLRLTVYGGTGLTSNSSDFISGTSLSYRL